MGDCGKVEKWKSGGVEEWRSGGVEEWKSGKVEKWRGGGVDPQKLKYMNGLCAFMTRQEMLSTKSANCRT